MNEALSKLLITSNVHTHYNDIISLVGQVMYRYKACKIVVGVSEEVSQEVRQVRQG